MSEMIDRVAAAIAKVSEDEIDPYRACSKAAIEAMRKPTEEMVRNVFAAQLNDDDEYTRRIWENMIDTVLSHPHASGEASAVMDDRTAADEQLVVR